MGERKWQVGRVLRDVASREAGAETLEYLSIAAVTLTLVALIMEYFMRSGYQTVIDTAKPILELTIQSFGW